MEITFCGRDVTTPLMTIGALVQFAVNKYGRLLPSKLKQEGQKR